MYSCGFYYFLIMNKTLKPSKYSCRLLHYIFKIVDRQKNTTFFQEVLGMKVLRHEEYKEERAPINDKPSIVLWSKTFFGYGPESDHFAVELVWNSEINSYEMGNAFEGITIVSRESIARARALKWPVKMKEDIHYVESPDGYRIFLIDEPQPQNKDPVVNLTMNSSHITSTANYWLQISGIGLLMYRFSNLIFSYGKNQPYLVFNYLEETITHGSGKGKVVVSIPFKDLQNIETTSRDTNNTILAPLKRVEINENQTVNLLFLADPDSHEICFVDEESFKKISSYDPLGEAFLYHSMKKYETCKAK